jgi:hypothetical protein
MLRTERGYLGGFRRPGIDIKQVPDLTKGRNLKFTGKNEGVIDGQRYYSETDAHMSEEGVLEGYFRVLHQSSTIRGHFFSPWDFVEQR